MLTCTLRLRGQKNLVRAYYTSNIYFCSIPNFQSVKKLQLNVSNTYPFGTHQYIAYVFNTEMALLKTFYSSEKVICKRVRLFVNIDGMHDDGNLEIYYLRKRRV